MIDPGRSPIHILHVDDEPDFADIVASFLEAEDERFTVETATSASEGAERFSHDIDCIVSDYDMPDRNGIAFLEDIREKHPDLPFILYTGKGSEEIASEAISAGVSDYLQKQRGTSQYTVLANRIANAVTQYRAEREIEETERRYQRLIEESTDLISVVDENGTFQYLSPAAEHLLGYRSDELMGENGFEFVHPDDQKASMDVFSALVTNPERRVTTEFRFEHADGTWIWLGVRGRNLLDDSTIDGLVVYTWDITDRKQHEQELRQKERRYQAIFNDPNILVGLTDTDGTILDTNQTALEYVDATLEEVTGRPLWETAWFEDSEATHDTVREWITQATAGEYTEFQLDFVRPDGEPCVVEGVIRPVRDDDGDIVSLLVSGRDITEATEQNRELERYEAIVENSEDGIYVFDDQGRFKFVNQRVTDVSGIRHRDWVDEPVSILADLGTLTEREVAAVEDGIDAVARGETEQVSIELTPDLPRGIEVLDLRLTPLRTDAGDDRVIGFTRDVTERHRREQELESTNERLEEFAGVISHDLRNPLNVAEGQLELACDECESDHLDAVRDAHQRMSRLIGDMLGLTRGGESATGTEEVVLADVVDVCWQNVETEAATLINETTRTVRANRSRLQQLLENLIRNAVDHGGASITVTVGDLSNGFYVADDGPGIPVGEREAVFEAGYSTAAEGTGFGLAIVQDIADAYDWTIDVVDSETGGARFEISGLEI